MISAHEHFDCVVVGSGFGGAVTAERLAGAGRTVLVLERGKPSPPGSFPRCPIGFKNSLWDPSEGLHGLFDLWSFSGLDALISSGLGGGSLIYANVLLRKDEHWFVKDGPGGESWPLTRADLEDHYERFVEDRNHEATVAGWVGCDALGGRLPVEGGHFNLFVDQDGDGRHKRMYYRLYFRDVAGHPLTLVGFKEVRDDPGLDVWSDTSTLYTRVLTGHVAAEQEPEAAVLATAILHILPHDFARQMTTFRVRPAHRVDALARFGTLFAGALWKAYKSPAAR